MEGSRLVVDFSPSFTALIRQLFHTELSWLTIPASTCHGISRERKKKKKAGKSPIQTPDNHLWLSPVLCALLFSPFTQMTLCTFKESSFCELAHKATLSSLIRDIMGSLHTNVNMNSSRSPATLEQNMPCKPHFKLKQKACEYATMLYNRPAGECASWARGGNIGCEKEPYILVLHRITESFPQNHLCTVGMTAPPKRTWRALSRFGIRQWWNPKRRNPVGKVSSWSLQAKFLEERREQKELLGQDLRTGIEVMVWAQRDGRSFTLHNRNLSPVAKTRCRHYTFFAKSVISPSDYVELCVIILVIRYLFSVLFCRYILLGLVVTFHFLITCVPGVSPPVSHTYVSLVCYLSLCCSLSVGHCVFLHIHPNSSLLWSVLYCFCLPFIDHILSCFLFQFGFLFTPRFQLSPTCPTVCVWVPLCKAWQWKSLWQRDS